MEKSRLLYNETFKVEETIATEWLTWMKETQIPNILKTGLFESFQINKLLFTEEDGGVTFAIQFICQNMHNMQMYQRNHVNHFQTAMQADFKDKYVVFRTLMEIIE